MERSLSKKSKVLEDYVNKKADFPTSYFGPDDSVLSSLPDYGRSNAALPRGEDPSILPYQQIKAKETVMSNTKQELARIAREIESIKTQLSKSAGKFEPTEELVEEIEMDVHDFLERNIKRIGGYSMDTEMDLDYGGLEVKGILEEVNISEKELVKVIKDFEKEMKRKSWFKEHNRDAKFRFEVIPDMGDLTFWVSA